MTTATTEPLARRSLLDFTFSALEQELVAGGLRPAHTRALWRALHGDPETDLGQRADFLPPLRRWVAGHVGDGRRLFVERLGLVADTASGDGLTRLRPFMSQTMTELS